MSTTAQKLDELISQEYKHGFVTEMEADGIPKGLYEDVIRLISAKKNEPDFMLEWRLKAYRHWLTMKEPTWPTCIIRPIDYQDIIYYSAPKTRNRPEEPGRGRSGAAGNLREARHSAARNASCWPVSPSTRCSTACRSATTFKDKLAELGIIFCSFSEAVREHPELVRAVPGLASCPTSDNFFAALNSAVFSDGSFCYIPKGVRCPMELSTYFRINAAEHRPVRAHADHCRRGQPTSAISKAAPRPMRDENQLHAAVVELIALGDARRSSIRRCRTGTRATRNGKGGIYNFVTKRGECRGADARISWTQVETGSAITWKYPIVHPARRQLDRASSTRWR